MSLDEPERKPVIFDGNDDSTSFVRFLEDLKRSSPGEHLQDLVPSRLYGNALRVYECLHPKCQQSWEDLEFAMAWSFPGFSSTEQEVLFPTAVAVPPPTSWSFASWSQEDDTADPEKVDASLTFLSRSIGGLLFNSLLRKRDKSQSVWAPRDLIRWNRITVLEIPQIDVHSLYLERYNSNTVTRVVELPLNDTQAVSKAAKLPILTIPAKDAKLYYIGLTFVINFEVMNVSSVHIVHKPSFSRVIFGGGDGRPCAVHPARVMQTCDRITSFLRDWKGRSTGWDEAPPGRYTIQSYVQTRIKPPEVYDRSDRKPHGSITWRIDLS